MTKYCLANIDELSKEIFQQNVEAGWWDDMDRCVYTCIQLIVTEIAEATEGERKNLMDDHLPHRKMGEVELADALIRTLDLMGRFDVKISDRLDSEDVEDLAKQAKGWTVGRMHLIAVGYCLNLAEINNEDECLHSVYFSWLVQVLCGVAQALGYDIFSATEEKLAYNKSRLDHKREERAKENGKKF